MAILVLATLSPFELRAPTAGLGTLLSRALHPELTPADVVDAVRNVVLFAGWGLLWVLSAGRRPDRRRPDRRWAVAGAVLTGAAISVGLELTQLFVPTRTTSVLDVLTNTAGSLLGALSSVGLVLLARRQRSRRSFLGVPASHVALGYGIAVLFEAAFPLMRSGQPGAYGGPGARLAWSLHHLWLGTLGQLPFYDALLFFPAGFLAVLALVEAGEGYGPAARWTALGGLGVALVGEAAHLLLAQPFVLGAIVVHALAVAAGAWTAGRTVPRMTRRWRGRWRPLLFLAAYVAVLAMWSWRPFDLQLPASSVPGGVSWSRLVPMASLGMRGDLYSVSDVTVSFFLFVPVGCVLAAWPPRRRGPASGVLPAFGLALLLEAGQLFVASRFVDVTDALVTFAGAAVAWAVIREAGYPVRGTLFEKERGTG